MPEVVATTNVPVMTMNSPMKPFVPGEADARQRRDDEERRVDRHRLREAAEVVELARVAAVVDDAEEEEERAGRDAVVDHLEDARPRATPASAAKRPSITYPRCATDEYAMRRFTSSCFQAQSAP